MAGIEIRRYAEDRRGQASNFVIGVLAAALTVVGDTLLFPTLIVAAFVATLTESFVVVGAVPAIGAGAWYLAQVLAGPVIASFGRKLPWAVGATVVRAAALSLLAYVVSRADQVSRDELLQSVLICFAAFSFASGFTATARTAVYIRAVPGQHQPLFFRAASIAGAVAAVVAGVLAARVLGSDGPAFPDNYTRVFSAGAVAAGGVALLLLLTREPGRIPASGRGDTSGVGGSGPLGLTALADPAYRRFCLFRTMLGLSAIADPFYILFALQSLGISSTRVGWFLLVLVVARVASAPLWAWLNRAQGTRVTLQIAGLLRILPPLLAISLPYVIDSQLWRDRVTDPNAVPIAVGVIFALLGIVLGGLQTATFGYLVESLPARERAAAIGFSNLTLAVVAAAPVAGGLLLRETGADFEQLFLVGGGFALIATLAGGLLAPSQARQRQSAATFRLRRTT